MEVVWSYVFHFSVSMNIAATPTPAAWLRPDESFTHIGMTNRFGIRISCTHTVVTMYLLPLGIRVEKQLLGIIDKYM
jgi:hypothetical protein